MDGGTLRQVVVDNEFRDAILDVCLNGTFEGACAKLHVVALFSHKLFGVFAEVDGIAKSTDTLIESMQFDIDNLLDSRQVELVESDKDNSR